MPKITPARAVESSVKAEKRRAATVYEGRDGFLFDARPEATGATWRQTPSKALDALKRAKAVWLSIVQRYHDAGASPLIVVVPDRERIYRENTLASLREPAFKLTASDALRQALAADGVNIHFPLADLRNAASDAQIYHKGSPLWTSWAAYLATRSAVATIAPQRVRDFDRIGAEPVDVAFTSHTARFAAASGRSVDETLRLLRLTQRGSVAIASVQAGAVSVGRYEHAHQRGGCIVAGDESAMASLDALSEIYGQTVHVSGTADAADLIGAVEARSVYVFVQEAAFVEPQNLRQTTELSPSDLEALFAQDVSLKPGPPPVEPVYAFLRSDRVEDGLDWSHSGEGWLEPELFWTLGTGVVLNIKAPPPLRDAWDVMISCARPKYGEAFETVRLTDLISTKTSDARLGRNGKLELQGVRTDAQGWMSIAISHGRAPSPRQAIGEDDDRDLGLALQWARLSPTRAD